MELTNELLRATETHLRANVSSSYIHLPVLLTQFSKLMTTPGLELQHRDKGLEVLRRRAGVVCPHEFQQVLCAADNGRLRVR